MVETFHLIGWKSQFFLITGKIQFGRDSHYDLLSMYSRKRGNSDIIILSVYHNGHTSVLRFPFL